MSSIKDRLLSAEEDFQSALLGGEDAITAFNERWESLLGDVDSAMDSSGLDDNTVSLAHSTAMRIAILAETSISLFTSHNDITSQLVDEVEALLGELSLKGDAPKRTLSSTPTPSPPQATLHLPASPDALVTRSGRKRTRDASESSPPATPSFKRIRCHASPAPAPYVESPTSLRSPAPLLSLVTHLSTPSSDTCAYAPIHKSRKRRFSDTEIPTISTAAKRLHVGPRLHAVSDSFQRPSFSSQDLVVPVSPAPSSQETLQETLVGSLHERCKSPVSSTNLSPPFLTVPSGPSDWNNASWWNDGNVDVELEELLKSLVDSSAPAPTSSDPLISPIGADIAPLLSQPSFDVTHSGFSSSLIPSSPLFDFRNNADTGISHLPALETLSQFDILPQLSSFPVPDCATPCRCSPHPEIVVDNDWTSWFASVEGHTSLPVPHSSSLFGSCDSGSDSESDSDSDDDSGALLASPPSTSDLSSSTGSGELHTTCWFSSLFSTATIA